MELPLDGRFPPPHSPTNDSNVWPLHHLLISRSLQSLNEGCKDLKDGHHHPLISCSKPLGGSLNSWQPTLLATKEAESPNIVVFRRTFFV